MGETGADMLSHDLGLGYLKASIILGSFFILAMVFEFCNLGPLLARYWFGIVVTATVGTTLADFISRTLELGYFKASIVLIAIFAVHFAVWHRFDRQDEVDKDRRVHTGGFYWAAILLASVLGTTLGDYVSNGSSLGFGGGSVVLGSLLMLVFAVGKWTKIPNQVAYWAAIILTSTFGASTGDYLSKEEGANMGTLKATLAVAVALIAVVGYQWFSDNQRLKTVA